MEIHNEDILPLFTKEQIQARIKEIAASSNSRFKDEEVYVVGVLKGAVMFDTDLVKYLTMPVKMEFIRLSSYGSSTSSSGKVNPVNLTLPNINGKNVVIVEDIVDTGLTAKFLLDFINSNFQTKTTIFCSLLDKKCRRQIEVTPDYVGFEIDDKFVIGYGLDFDGQFRNLDYIGYVKQ